MSPAPTPDMTQMRTTTAATKPAGPRARRGISGVPRMESHSRNRARSRPAHPSEPRPQEADPLGAPTHATGPRRAKAGARVVGPDVRGGGFKDYNRDGELYPDIVHRDCLRTPARREYEDVGC